MYKWNYLLSYYFFHGFNMIFNIYDTKDLNGIFNKILLTIHLYNCHISGKFRDNSYSLDKLQQSHSFLL